MKGWRRPFPATIASTGLLLPSAVAETEALSSIGLSRAGSMDPRREALLERDHLTGDWRGARQRWLEQGVTLHGEWIGEFWANFSGGVDTGVVAEGLAQLNLDLDLQRLVGWRGAEVRLGGILPHGESPTGELTGDLLGVSNIDAFRDEIAPYEVWWQQSDVTDAWNLRAGLLVADGEFAFTEGGSAFLNSAFGWPAGIALNTRNTGPAYFRSSLGIRLRQTVSESWQWQVGVYDGDTFDGDPDHDPVASWSLGGDDGWFLIGEIARWRVGSGEASRGLHVRCGGWLHTAAFDEADSETSRGGVFLAADYELWSDSLRAAQPGTEAAAEDDSGFALSMFGRLEWAPQKFSSVEWSGHGGWFLEGLLPARFDDAIGLGVAWARGSDRESAEDPGGFPSEIALELTWRISLTRFWEIQPDYQWILDVGGDSERKPAHLFGIRTHLTF
ncbi:MAG: carbohydrate porin [Verrucomicrobiales bacterium]|nr:carbohydrate porin [Verrucomicrobiales bacterium]